MAKTVQMKTRTLLLALFFAVAIVAAGNGPRGKMSAFVRKTADSGLLVKKAKGTAAAPRMTVFVCADGDKADSVLTANGCKVYDRRGDIFIASVPVDRLDALATTDRVRRIEASATCRLDMDTTTTIINALPVYAGKALPQAYTGRGVVVGVMDVGFDLTHPNFVDSTGTGCRIRAFWDQLSSDTVGSSFIVGRDYVGAEIAEKKHSSDGLIQTHGTHTLGCAAGGGYDSPYRGMAFESDICAVSNAVNSSVSVIDSANLYKYTSAVDALGFKYIFDYAERLGRPCVASFSEGYTVGEDSEDSLYNEYLSTLTGPGRIIVVSAGNESVHAGYMAKPVGLERAGSFLRSSEKESTVYVHSDGRFRLLLLAYHDGAVDTLTVSSDSCTNGYDKDFPFVLPSGERLANVNVYRYPSAFTAGDTVYCVTFSGNAPIDGAVPVALVVDGTQSGVYVRCTSSAWFDNALADDTWNAAETSHNVHAPACFPCVVTVGSTIHRTGFTNYNGRHYDYSQSGRNDGVRSYYSSIGPGMFQCIKPDVMAPGDNVVSSYSSYYLEKNPTANDINSDVIHFDYNGRTYAWNSNTGTSMATPVVAGAIALWLQAKPTLTPDEVKNIIAATARHPEDGFDYPNNYYGHGEIDVYRGLLYALGLDGIDELSATPLHDVAVALRGSGRLTLDFSTPPSEPFSVSVFSLSGAKVYSTAVSPSCNRHFELALPLEKGAVYAVQIEPKAKERGGSMLVRCQ